MVPGFLEMSDKLISADLDYKRLCIAKDQVTMLEAGGWPGRWGWLLVAGLRSGVAVVVMVGTRFVVSEDN